MSESRAVYLAATSVRPTIQQVIEDAEEMAIHREHVFLLTMLNGLEGQAAALANQRSAVLMQAAAIRQRLGLEEKKR